AKTRSQTNKAAKTAVKASTSTAIAPKTGTKPKGRQILKSCSVSLPILSESKSTSSSESTVSPRPSTSRSHSKHRGHASSRSRSLSRHKRHKSRSRARSPSTTSSTTSDSDYHSRRSRSRSRNHRVHRRRHYSSSISPVRSRHYRKKSSRYQRRHRSSSTDRSSSSSDRSRSHHRRHKTHRPNETSRHHKKSDSDDSPVKRTSRKQSSVANVAPAKSGKRVRSKSRVGDEAGNVSGGSTPIPAKRGRRSGNAGNVSVGSTPKQPVKRGRAKSVFVDNAESVGSTLVLDDTGTNIISSTPIASRRSRAKSMDGYVGKTVPWLPKQIQFSGKNDTLRAPNQVAQKPIPKLLPIGIASTSKDVSNQPSNNQNLPQETGDNVEADDMLETQIRLNTKTMEDVANLQKQMDQTIKE
ncbi:serine/arginine repetitive matrix protein 2-like, partial [Contarinia nasturtii]|uniref:serine/arginine repetitive matrix protein 2-like n=1 Tax=Contarinia nasturtii TaxID=265458 RepID=UPI0012D3E495